MSPAGKCTKEIDAYCKDVGLGEGKVADCLSDQITEQDTASPKEGEGISADCREDVFNFKIERSTNINKNIPLGEPQYMARAGRAAALAVLTLDAPAVGDINSK